MMKKLSLIILLCLACVTSGAQTKFDAAEIGQLVTFLNLPSADPGKTNAEAIGITVKPTEANLAEWYKNLGIYTVNEGETSYIRDISLENKGDFRLGGSFVVENFKHLESLYLYGMGNEVKVKNCPALEKFRLMSNTDEEFCTERRLEITSCPKLWQLRIECFVTEYVLTGSNALAQVNISYTNFPVIDFSSQPNLQWIILNNNAFSDIKIPEPGTWRFEFKYNQVEPADVIKLIRKFRGDGLYLDDRFPLTEYTPQRIICRDTIAGRDSISVGTKIDLSGKATLAYGSPEKTYTGTFKWQYKKKESWGGTSTVDILPVTPAMKQGVYTIPPSLANHTIVATYECAPFFTMGEIQYFINAVPAGSAAYVQKKPGTFRLQVNSNDEALGTVSGSGDYKAGMKVPIAAQVVDPEAVFENWTIDRDVLHKDQNHTYTMPARDGEITGNFKYLQLDAAGLVIKDPTVIGDPPPGGGPTTTGGGGGGGERPPGTYLLKVASNNPDLGIVSGGNGYYKPGEKVPIKATIVKQEATFEKWTEPYGYVSNKADYIVEMKERDMYVSAFFNEGKIDTGKVHLILTSNLWCAKLSGSGAYNLGSKAAVLAEAPPEYKFEGWYLAGELKSPDAKFDYKLNKRCVVTLHAVYSNPSKPPKPPVFDRKYACTVNILDDNLPLNPEEKFNMLATGFIDYRPRTKDLWSPYAENNLGVLSFSFDTISYRTTNILTTPIGGGVIIDQRQIFMAMTIYEVTDKEIVASGGGYLFGLELFGMVQKFSKIHRIPYTLNDDGSVTLKKFNITGKEGQPLYDLTFWPAPDDMEIDRDVLWYERKEQSFDPRKHELHKKDAWEAVRDDVMPIVQKELKK